MSGQASAAALRTELANSAVVAILFQLTETDGVVNNTISIDIKVCPGEGWFCSFHKVVVLIFRVLTRTSHLRHHGRMMLMIVVPRHVKPSSIAEYDIPPSSYYTTEDDNK